MIFSLWLTYLLLELDVLLYEGLFVHSCEVFEAKPSQFLLDVFYLE
jgi:hypothetical protein